AGKKWGAQFLPRIGQEVVVLFVEGDPDRPLVIGSVYNAEQQPTYELGANKTQSGVKSRSSKGGAPDNFNELRFEDKKGSELFAIQAEKDQSILVKNDKAENVGHDETASVGNDQKLDVGNDQTNSIANDQKEKVGNDQSLEVGNDQSIKVTAN